MLEVRDHLDTHHAVSSMKMPSRSSCMKSSPPAQMEKLTSVTRRHTHSHTLQGRGLALTAQVLQDEIELPSGLEGVD